jgi:CHAT domain-containing protein
MRRAQDDKIFHDDNAHDEIELRDSTVDGKEEAQISSHGEVGGIRTEIVVPISKDAPHIFKSENISGCGFQWEAHMVVLSASDTARGQIMGEGVLNLPRALMIAGVPSVVVSQWKVGDQSTCELMKGFYMELKSGKDVSSSLRASMLKMIKNGGRVHEWAPFFVYGLPTVCLPTELQAATSSCLCDVNGTSSVTKPKLR